MGTRRRWIGGIALAVLLVLAVWAAYRPTPGTWTAATPSPLMPPQSAAATHGVDEEENPGPLKHVDCKKWGGHPDVFAAGGTCWKMIEVSPAPQPTPTPAR